MKLFFLLFLVVPGVLFAETAPGDEPGFWDSILQDMWQWVVDLVESIGASLMEIIIGGFGFDVNVGVGSDLMKYFQIGNYWTPIDLGFTLLFAYWAWCIMFIIIKMVLKLIPTVG